jgi:hypothetical protein
MTSFEAASIAAGLRAGSAIPIGRATPGTFISNMEPYKP